MNEIVEYSSADLRSSEGIQFDFRRLKSASVSVCLEIVVRRLEDDRHVNLKKSLAQSVLFFHISYIHIANALLCQDECRTEFVLSAKRRPRSAYRISRD